MRTKALLIVILIAMFSFTGCSSKSRGGTGPDGGISDQELALEGQRWGDGNIPVASGSGFFDDIFFGYDSSRIDPEYQDAIRTNAEALLQDPSLNVEIEGHCDERGTSEYNLALGEQRARSVATALKSYGVSPSRITTISYGEELPLDPGRSEEAYAKNRRVHFAVFRKQQ